MKSYLLWQLLSFLYMVNAILSTDFEKTSSKLLNSDLEKEAKHDIYTGLNYKKNNESILQNWHLIAKVIYDNKEKLILETIWLCPVSCFCKEYSSGKETVNCKNKKIRSFLLESTSLSKKLLLNLDNNNIREIYDEDLSYENIIELSISNNIIYHLDEKAFHFLSILEKLNLANNKITFISNNLFKKNINLRYINLRLNPLTIIEAHSFYYLYKLVELDLFKCDLKDLNFTLDLVRDYNDNCDYFDSSYFFKNKYDDGSLYTLKNMSDSNVIGNFNNTNNKTTYLPGINYKEKNQKRSLILIIEENELNFKLPITVVRALTKIGTLNINNTKALCPCHGTYTNYCVDIIKKNQNNTWDRYVNTCLGKINCVINYNNTQPYYINSTNSNTIKIVSDISINKAPVISMSKPTITINISDSRHYDMFYDTSTFASKPAIKTRKPVILQKTTKKYSTFTEKPDVVQEKIEMQRRTTSQLSYINKSKTRQPSLMKITSDTSEDDEKQYQKEEQDKRRKNGNFRRRNGKEREEKRRNNGSGRRRKEEDDDPIKKFLLKSVIDKRISGNTSILDNRTDINIRDIYTSQNITLYKRLQLIHSSMLKDTDTKKRLHFENNLNNLLIIYNISQFKNITDPQNSFTEDFIAYAKKNNITNIDDITNYFEEHDIPYDVTDFEEDEDENYGYFFKLEHIYSIICIEIIIIGFLCISILFCEYYPLTVCTCKKKYEVSIKEENPLYKRLHTSSETESTKSYAKRDDQKCVEQTELISLRNINYNAQPILHVQNFKDTSFNNDNKILHNTISEPIKFNNKIQTTPLYENMRKLLPKTHPNCLSPTIIYNKSKEAEYINIESIRSNNIKKALPEQRKVTWTDSHQSDSNEITIHNSDGNTNTPSTHEYEIPRIYINSEQPTSSHEYIYIS